MFEEEKGLDDDIAETTMITLLTNDGKEISINKKLTHYSDLLSSILENDRRETRITLHNVNSVMAEKIIEYLNYYDNNPFIKIKKPLVTDDLRDNIEMKNYADNSWYANYANLDNDTVIDIILAANYMGIQSLLLLACAQIAAKMKNKEPEEIKEMFG